MQNKKYSIIMILNTVLFISVLFSFIYKFLVMNSNNDISGMINLLYISILFIYFTISDGQQSKK